MEEGAVVNFNSAFEKADRLLEQKLAGSQYDKNEHLTEGYVNGSVKSEEHKKNKNQGRQ